jgi:hypothetical protein
MVRVSVVVAVTLVTLLSSTMAFANAATPTASPLSAGAVVLNANGTVTVTITGTWVWTFGVESATTAGLAATVRHPCDSRTGVGWGIVWKDPADPGNAETYVTRRGSLVSLMVHVGSKGTNPVNGDSEVQFNAGDPCGTFVQTNVPHPGDGYDTGEWRGTHVYPDVSALPQAICVITYDLGFGRPPTPHRLHFDNNDNSVQWALFKTGTWDSSVTDDNCATLPPPVAAPPPTTAPPVKTVSHTTPRTAAPAPVPTKPSGVLAFTGFGRAGQLLALAGLILLVMGLVMYFTDFRKTWFWLLGGDRAALVLFATSARRASRSGPNGLRAGHAAPMRARPPPRNTRGLPPPRRGRR